MLVVGRPCPPCASVASLTFLGIAASATTALWSAQFFRQGDMEKTEGLIVSALMDRTKMGVSKCQPGVS